MQLIGRFIYTFDMSLKFTLNSFLLILLIASGLFVYRNILPRFFPFQYQVKQEVQLSGEYDSKEVRGVFHGEKTLSYRLPNPQTDSRVLGETTNKRIEVDLTNQRVYAYEGDSMVYNFLISSGLYDWTPRGTFWIWTKLRYTKMEGGSQALGTYYYLPNVPYVMFFANNQIPGWRGFSLHGTYWHNDFGRPKSHGCVNMRTEDAEKIFYWAEPMTQVPITIYGKYSG